MQRHAKSCPILDDFEQFRVLFTWQQRFEYLTLGFESFRSPAKFAKIISPLVCPLFVYHPWLRNRTKKFRGKCELFYLYKKNYLNYGNYFRNSIQGRPIEARVLVLNFAANADVTRASDPSCPAMRE
jgi:hypothetical protein